MNRILFLFFFFSLTFSSTIHAQQLDLFLKKTNSFLQKNVVGDKVKYSSINPTELNQLTQLVSQIAPKNLTPIQRKSFLINAYNILVIKGIANNYPISSTQKVPGFFDKIKYNVGGHAWTLNQIENEQIRKEYKDPRVHFVLNCAALSCPPITNYAYFPDSLDVQLERQTKLALNDNSFIYVKNEKNYISNIFKWYKSDFTENGSVVDYINSYRIEKLSSTARNINYPYNWMLNDVQSSIIPDNSSDISFIQSYTPSKLLEQGQLELQLFNNLYTQTAFRDENRNKVNLGQRQNYFTGLINILFGVHKDRKLNVGMDINLRSVRFDTEDSSPFKALGFRNNDINNRTGISSLGPTVKFAPFKNPNLSIKSSFLFPLVEDSESDGIGDTGSSERPWFDWNRYTWWNQLFFDKNIGLNWQLFLEADLLFRFAKSANAYPNDLPKEDLLDTPLSSFLSYFPSEKSTVYIMLQYSPRFGFNKVDTTNGTKSFDFHAIGDFAQTGLGFKYQIVPKIGLEISYTNFFTSSSQGAGSTFNLGIRYIN